MTITSAGWSQVGNVSPQFELEGSVKGKENFEPIKDVHISTDKGRFTTTLW